jgi:energy-coupling factor transporter ATP-binding protein EcfA2
MIQLNGAGKRYGPKILFEGVDWLVTPNERTGLVGANGTGKSSLLKVLAGMEGLDSGSVTMQKGVTLGYLPQDGLSLSGRTVFAECMTVFSDLRDLEIEQEELTHRMSELDPASAEYAQVADRFHQCEAEFHARDGYTVEAQVGSVLSGWDSRSATGRSAPKNSPAAGRCASRWPSCCSQNPTCCCSTSPPTISTWKRATGWKIIWRITPTPSCWFRTTAIFWMSRYARSPRSGTRASHFYTGGLRATNSRKRSARAA